MPSYASFRSTIWKSFENGLFSRGIWLPKKFARRRLLCQICPYTEASLLHGRRFTLRHIGQRVEAFDSLNAGTTQSVVAPGSRIGIPTDFLSYAQPLVMRIPDAREPGASRNGQKSCVYSAFELPFSCNRHEIDRSDEDAPGTGHSGKIRFLLRRSVSNFPASFRKDLN